MKKFMLEVAGLDRKLFSVLQTAYDATAELEHLRQGVLDYVQPEDPDNEGWLLGFISYALGELDRVEQNLSALYRECAGKELREYRLR